MKNKNESRTNILGTHISKYGICIYALYEIGTVLPYDTALTQPVVEAQI